MRAAIILGIVCVIAGVLMFVAKKSNAHLIKPSVFGDPQLVMLAKAINREDLHDIERLAHSGANLNGTGEEGITPLIYAAGNRKKKSYGRANAVGSKSEPIHRGQSVRCNALHAIG